MICQSLINILPTGIATVISKRLNAERVYELRLRANRPVMINYGGAFYYLTPGGLRDSAVGGFTVDGNEIGQIVIKASEYSLYAFNDRICGGFLTLKGGVRLGLCGETVWDGGAVKTVKNFTSLNIRVPHEVIGCAEKVYEYAAAETVFNTLIVSPPGAGKTTLLRDLARILGDAHPVKNVLVCDERNELAAVSDGEPQLDVGAHTDIIGNCTKEYAFGQGIRALRPDVIITDELFGAADLAAVEYAAASGVKVIASVHAADPRELTAKAGFCGIIKKRVFSRYAALSDSRGPGTLAGIFDGDLNTLYAPPQK
ncbi:MAG: Flp pilus assembly complex ATPase component TadA [Clostridiales bacterium]|jgi:stage III sporulation protein AA|nr:Flp pilus assembly complex ATPase component TadA [Clostridiales bacterium]